MEDNKSNKTLHIILWVAQIVLGLMFIMAGCMKAFLPIEELAKNLPWVAESSSKLVRFIGLHELPAGLALILPSLLRIKPKLTVFAALGLAVIMVFALVFHITRGEYEAIGVNIVLGAIALFIAWGRSKKVPILPK